MNLFFPLFYLGFDALISVACSNISFRLKILQQNPLFITSPKFAKKSYMSAFLTNLTNFFQIWHTFCSHKVLSVANKEINKTTAKPSL
jgi:hypothetical protein